MEHFLTSLVILAASAFEIIVQKNRRKTHRQTEAKSLPPTTVVGVSKTRIIAKHTFLLIINF